jgi:hypothetical protein
LWFSQSTIKNRQAVLIFYTLQKTLGANKMTTLIRKKKAWVDRKAYGYGEQVLHEGKSEHEVKAALRKEMKF